jgi:hypothetical protein
MESANIKIVDTSQGHIHKYRNLKEKNPLVKLVTYQNYTKMHGPKNIKSSTDCAALSGYKLCVSA